MENGQRWFEFLLDLLVHESQIRSAVCSAVQLGMKEEAIIHSKEKAAFQYTTNANKA